MVQTTRESTQQVQYVNGVTDKRGGKKEDPLLRTPPVRCCWHGAEETPGRWTARAFCFLHHRTRDGDSFLERPAHARDEGWVCGICGRVQCEAPAHEERRVEVGRPWRVWAALCGRHQAQAAAACHCSWEAARQVWRRGSDFAHYTSFQEVSDVGTAGVPLGLVPTPWGPESPEATAAAESDEGLPDAGQGHAHEETNSVS